MKTNQMIRSILVAATLAIPAMAGANEDVTNRFTISARFGLNLSAKFGGVRASGAGPANPRTTPDGDPYNYDNGYVLTDVSGNFGGQTWYLGYDDSSRQISGNTLLLSRSTLAGSAASPSFDSDPQYGFEAAYDALWNANESFRYGFQFAVSYLDIDLSDNGAVALNLRRTTDAYAFTPGTTPPAATPGNPYQGSFNGPGFVVSDTPVSSTTAIVQSGTAQDHRELEGALYGLRLGPNVEWLLGEQFMVSMSAGLAVGILEIEASWRQTAALGGGLTATTGGSGDDYDVMVGFYVGANAAWRFAERWSLVGGVQYQNLGDYSHTFAGREVELDLSESIFLNIGLGWDF